MKVDLESVFANLAHNQQLALLRFTDTIMNSTNLDQLFNDCLSLIPKIIPGESFMIVQHDYRNNKNKYFITKGISLEVMKRYHQICHRDRNYQLMMSTKQTLTNRNNYKDDEWQRTESFRLVFEPTGIFHFAASPVLVKNNVNATIHVHRRFHQPFTIHEIKCCQLLTQYLSKGIEMLFPSNTDQSIYYDDVCLTQRENEVLQLLGRGLKVAEISIRLGITPNTVKDHLKKIYSKLDVSTRSEAVVKGIKKGLLYIG
ncbi:LuxR C-terminal-related transcriptional regulator [Bacillus sp. X1(2014)]|uniref:LuxR C-terminal-related transcriptional regulator n=1 Tax=Bacillus sp. X1(2014) TaxID=1565991 RepID=UPI0011A83793|nr:LuxR C-terminal-related transcriptional regulator [Bacillus sp. X1(2014)]